MTVPSGVRIASFKPLIHVVYAYVFIVNHHQTVSERIHNISNRFPGIYDAWIDGFSLGTRSLWTRDVITPLNRSDAGKSFSVMYIPRSIVSLQLVIVLLLLG